MTNDRQSGNKSNQGSFLDVMMALKRNVMRDLNVADLVQITQVGTSIKASLLTNPTQVIECVTLQNLDIQQNDIALAIFTNTDFRVNLEKYKNGQKIQKLDNSTLHSKNAAVIVGLVYRKQTEGEQQ